MKGTLAKIGAEPRGGSPQKLADQLAQEGKRWASVVKALNLKVE
jgi:hypothetical protein